ncbi:MAG: hypothetical protein Q9214_001491 [Letrouitia sp. 1 TL-2023]
MAVNEIVTRAKRTIPFIASRVWSKETDALILFSFDAETKSYHVIKEFRSSLAVRDFNSISPTINNHHGHDSKVT